MNKPLLAVRERSNGFAVVRDIGTLSEYVIASGIQDESTAKMFAAAPELASAAIFAVQMLNAQGTDPVLHMAYAKLVNALAYAGLDMSVKTPERKAP